MTRQTLEQQLAAAELKANKLRAQLTAANRKADTRRKIVLGGMVLAAMEHDAAFRRSVVSHLRKLVTRPIDIEAVADLMGDVPSPTPGPHMAADMAAE